MVKLRTIASQSTHPQFHHTMSLESTDSIDTDNMDDGETEDSDGISERSYTDQQIKPVIDNALLEPVEEGCI